MSEYLKMDDAFPDGAPGFPAYWSDEKVKHAAHAINSHDALVAQRDELLAVANDLYRGYVRIMEAGRDRIMELGGQCDPVDVMERCDGTLILARSAIDKANGGAK